VPAIAPLTFRPTTGTPRSSRHPKAAPGSTRTHPRPPRRPPPVAGSASSARRQHGDGVRRRRL